MSARLSEAAYAAMTGQAVTKRSKYHATAVVLADGVLYMAKAAKAAGIVGQRFDSKAEARRFLDLQLLERAGQISELRCQPVYEIHALNGTKVGVYRGDFSYFDKATRCAVLEDCKGVATPVYRLKKRLVEAEYSLTIREVRA